MKQNFFFVSDNTAITITAESEDDAWVILRDEVKRPETYRLDQVELVV